MVEARTGMVHERAGALQVQPPAIMHQFFSDVDAILPATGIRMPAQH
ncbi:hypothetical protein G6N74_17170 [Mesorhizobium sp. CGMCC 1.15528]|uniref:Uncharacterized protein n=1 Tax=Mesorhizobium zhangyense TaxID=1776730 RepID=A0A7C9V905_9HYPH|nr:hypothetical protein [Mesorhizobium zhangyense]NGN42803.1 hypothetical protein [Mesorhizobium zhangyense]